MLTTEDRKKLHLNYMENSDTYRGMYESFGPTLSIDFADRMAFTHGTTLRELVADVPEMQLKGRIRTLDFMLTLGY